MNKLFKIICVLWVFLVNLNPVFARIFSVSSVYYETIDETRVVVIKNQNKAYTGDIYIPETVSPDSEEISFQVVGIRKNTFSNCPDLSSVNMKDCHIAYLPDFLFFNCPNLKNVELPLSLKRIGEYSFLNCSSINTLLVPDGTEIIEDFAFLDCRNLEAVYLPDTLKYLGQGAFKNCDRISGIALPQNIEFVEEACFENCTALENVLLGDKIKKICKFAFKNCTRLKNLEFPKSLKVIRLSAFARCDNMDEICIPENVEELSSTSFGYCFGIKKVIFKGQRPPRKIAYDAFAYPCSPFPCSQDVEIIIPDGTKKNFKKTIDYRFLNRNYTLKEVNENILYP